jgi:WD40 repeat protein
MLPHGVLALLLASLAAQDPKPEPLPHGAVLRMGSSTGPSSGYRGTVEGVSFSADGKTIASAGDSVRLWDVASRKETLVLDSDQNNPTSSVAISPDGKLVANSTAKGTIVLRELPSGKETRTLAIPGVDQVFGSGYVTNLTFSKGGDTLLSVALDSKVILWDVASGKPTKQLHHDGVRAAGWTADEKLLVTGGYKDRSVRVWDVASERELYQLDGEGEVAISPDGRRIAYAGTDRKGWVWEIDRTKEPQPLAWKGKFVGSLQFSPDSRTLAVSGDGKIVLFDVATGKQLSEFKSDTYRVLAFSPDGKTLAFGKYMAVGLISLPEGTVGELTVIQPGRHQSMVSSVAFSPDGKTLASAAHDATIRLWDAATGRELKLLRGHSYWMNQLVWSKDGETIASAGQDDTLRLWEARTGKESLKIKCGDTWPTQVVLSEDGKTLTAVGGYNTVTRYDSTGKLVFKRKGSGYPVQNALSPDGSLLVVAESDFGNRKASFKLLEAETGTLRASLGVKGQHFYPRLVFSPDGKLLAWGRGGDGIHITDLATGEIRTTLEGSTENWPSHGALAFSSDGALLASGGDDKIIRIHEVATGKELAKLTGHKGPVTSLGFSADGRRLASGSGDTSILIWDATAWKK